MRERGGWDGELRKREGRVRKRWKDERCWEREKESGIYGSY